MKPLILVLLLAISVEAQSLPEVARKERERQAKAKSTRVFTTEDAKAASSTLPTPPAAAPAEVKTEAKPGEPAATPPAATAPSATEPAATAQTPATTPKPAAEPPRQSEAARRYAEELARLRARVIVLQDGETMLQLRLNDLKNQFLAPVTDTYTRTQVQSKIEQAQLQLSATQRELADTRRAIQLMEVQGPPKP